MKRGEVMDKGTIIRTVILGITWINQLLTVFGKNPIPLTEADIENMYLAGSTIVTGIASVWAWFKNNYVTKKGKKQKVVLQQNGLTK